MNCSLASKRHNEYTSAVLLRCLHLRFSLRHRVGLAIWTIRSITRKEFITVALIGFCWIGVVIYGSRDQSGKRRDGIAENSAQASSDSGTIAQDRSPRQPVYPPAPPRPAPPPPFPGTPNAAPVAPEPERSVSDAAKEYVTWVERYLPSGSKVYMYPVNTRLEAAIINADLDDDGVAETVVVYTTRKPTAEEGTLTLMLGVLTSEGDKKALRLQASTPLAGEIFFNPQIEGIGAPFAVRSVTGRNRPEIIVLSGAGASVGGALQVFSYDRSGLTEVARIGGHFFRVRSSSRGKPSVITAQSRYDEEARVYEFKGDKFQETGRTKR